MLILKMNQLTCSTFKRRSRQPADIWKGARIPAGTVFDLLVCMLIYHIAKPEGSQAYTAAVRPTARCVLK